jgi:hypothetical protein
MIINDFSKQTRDNSFQLEHTKESAVEETIRFVTFDRTSQAVQRAYTRRNYIPTPILQ